MRLAHRHADGAVVAIRHHRRRRGTLFVGVFAVVVMAGQPSARAEIEDPRWAVSGSLGFDGLNTDVGWGAAIGLSVGYILTDNIRVGVSLMRLSGSTQSSSDAKVGAGFTEFGPYLEAGLSSGSKVGGHVWVYARVAPSLFAYGGEQAPTASDAPDPPSTNVSVRTDAGFMLAGTYFGVGPFVSARVTTSPKPIWWGLGLKFELTF